MPSPVPTLQQSATWSSKALALTNSQNPQDVTTGLLEILREMHEQGVDPLDRREHPAIQVAVAQLAELAGLSFHWPSDAAINAQRLISRYRAENSCIPLSN